MRIKTLFTLCTLTTVLSGCANLGQEEFTCEGLQKNGVCAGPHDIYELTNHRENLEGLTLEQLDKQINGHNHTSSANLEEGAENLPTSHHPVMPSQTSSSQEVTVYHPRTLEQHTPYDYQKAEAIPQTRFPTSHDSEFSAWPNNGEPMAPESLAVMSEPEPLRILVNSYRDESGFLNMPGYVYVDTNPRTWQVGRDSTLRPSRIIPLELKRSTQQSMQRIQQRSQGVDGLGVEVPTEGAKE